MNSSKTRFISIGEKIVDIIDKKWKNSTFTKKQIHQELINAKIKSSNITIKNTLSTLKRNNFIILHGTSKFSHYTINESNWNPSQIHLFLNRKSIENKKMLQAQQ